MRDDSYDDITEITINEPELEDDIQIYEPERDVDSDAFLEQIGESITKQMEEELPEIDISEVEMSETVAPEPQTPKSEISEQEIADSRKWYQRYPKWAIPSALGGIIVIILCLIVFVTPIGRNLFFDSVAERATSLMEFQPVVSITDIPTPTIAVTEAVTITPLPTVTEAVTEEAEEATPRHEDYAVNILLIGEDMLDAVNGRGKTDLLIIATLNTNDQIISLTSLMRDTMVSIPEYGDYPLSNAYQLGGMQLLFDTIEKNFLIVPDGYVRITYDSFEKVVNLMGGIEVELTETEAGYLNSTNYISDKESRCVTMGHNILNGSQALGYCRIKSVGTKANEYGDFGRTTRQKRILRALMDRCKSMSYVDLLITMNECLPMIVTDITSSELSSYLKIAYGIGFDSDINMGRIPVKDSYHEVNLSGNYVLIPDMSINIKELHTMIFGDYIGDPIPTEGPSITLVPTPVQ